MSEEAIKEVPVEPISGEPYGWTQPQCQSCWDREHSYPPVVLLRGNRAIEVCVDCGDPTASGIYIRRDPRMAQYPSLID